MSKKRKLAYLERREADVEVASALEETGREPIPCMTTEKLNEFSDLFQEVLDFSDAEEPECRATIQAIWSILSARKYIHT